jgi:hypothetical protein
MKQRVLLSLLFFCSFIATAGDTVLKLYRPFGETIEQVSPMIKESISGQCVKQSELIVREDAWRCMAEGRVYDPCFVKPVGTKTKAVCPQSPWIGESVQIVLQTKLNNDKNTPLDMSTAFPWAVELDNGEKCQAIDSKELVEGMAVHYRCTNHHLLLGPIQRCKNPWAILEKTSDGMQAVTLAKAWF